MDQDLYQSPKVSILMTSYQGELYIQEQIESILNQSYSDFSLIISDDGSVDRTLNILFDYQKKYPDKIQVHLKDPKRARGVIQNFSHVISLSNADYVLFADQDDVWEENKVAMTVAKLQEMENEYSCSTPLLVHTDLKVVDSRLNMISPSFWKYCGLNPAYDSLNRLLVQNVVTGCTMGINRALINMSRDIPTNVMMHDWWLGLVATVFGKIAYLKESPILYRQHAHNILGARRKTWGSLIKNFLFKNQRAVDEVNKIIAKRYEQARVFKNYFDSNQDFNGFNRLLIENFIQMERLSYTQQIKTKIKYSFYRNGFIFNLLDMIAHGFYQSK